MHICFLDIDGTLVLTGGAGQAAFAGALAEDFGIPEIDSQVAFAGRSDRAIAMDLFRSHGIAESETNWLRFREGYLARLQASVSSRTGFVLPGVPEFLTQLAERGDVAIGLLTGNLREGARIKLEHYGLWHWFAFGGFGDEYSDRCQIAAAALAAAKSHVNGQMSNRPYGQILVIGDTVHDIDCGRSIGARCIAVPTGHTPAETLRRSAPDLLVDTLADFKPIMDLLEMAQNSRPEWLSARP